MPGLREAAHEGGRQPAAEQHRASASSNGPGLRRPLLTAIQTEVIPRLMLAHGLAASRDDATASPKFGTGQIGAGQVEAFVELTLTGSDEALSAFVAGLEERGVRIEDLFLDLLAPSARRLGEYWEADRCSFTDVTVAVSRLQRTMHELASRLDFEIERVQQAFTAIFIPAPGEQHTFGVTMVAEFFRRAGWTVSDALPRDEAEIVDTLRGRQVSLIGLSLSSEVLIDRLASVIASIRSLSCKSDVSILVGGSVFFDHPDWAERVGADALALDGKQGVIEGQRLVSAGGARFASPA